MFTCIVCYMGMRTAESLPIVDLLYFVLLHQCWCIGACTHTPTHTDTHTYIICTRAPPLQRLQSAHKENGRRRQIRRGTRVLLQKERKHIGRAFNLPQPCQIEHPDQTTSRGLRGDITLQNIKFHPFPDIAVPGTTEVLFLDIINVSMQ